MLPCQLFLLMSSFNVTIRYHRYHKYAKEKESSYLAQYPILRIAQSALHFTFLTDLYNLLLEASSDMLQLMHECCPYIYPPLVNSQVLDCTAE